MARIKITIALDRYDRHIPFFLGTVKQHPDIDLRALEVGMVPPRINGIDRHGRMLRDNEFDVCELSFSSYIIAKSRGLAFTAIPVFPRRLFSANHIFVNADKGIENPSDLIGRRVGVWSFQTTMSVLAKGDLKREYAVPWDQITWCTLHKEELPVDAKLEAIIEHLPPDTDIGALLIDGKIDALIHPHPPPAVLEAMPKVRRLFPDSQAESERYFHKYKYYPIMHLLAFRQELLDREPWLGEAVMELWEDAKRQAESFYEDPAFSQIAGARSAIERQRVKLGKDMWPSGLAVNRDNIQQFLEYSRDQGLTEDRLEPESLFHESMWNS